MTNLIGHSLGRYHILERLGEGGMATVYKAYDTRLERDVAVKVIRRSAFPPDQIGPILKRFGREAKALARLSHPNILKVLDFGEHEGSPFLVLEYIRGGTLKQKLRGKTVPWRDAIRTLKPIAQALAYAHNHGIIHRDVKPSNILLTDKGESLLSDFGIAKILETETTETLTGSGVGIGTPEYMAPEQWTGSAAKQSDIYSLGIIFYEMITGRKPYTADTPAAILLKQATEPLPRPSRFVPDLPENIEKALIKALALKPEHRFKTMDEFATVLDLLEKGANSKKDKTNLQTLTNVTAGFGEPTFGTVWQEDSQGTQIQRTAASGTYRQGDVTMDWNAGAIRPTGGEKKPTWLYLLGGGIGIFALTCLIAAAVILSGSSLGVSAPEYSPPLQTQPTPVSPASNGLSPSTQNPPPAPTTQLATAFSPSPSPALPSSSPGGKIVFTCQTSGNSEKNEICIMAADGSGYRKLTNNNANNGWPSISPDGSLVLFSSDISGSWQIYSISVNGQSLQQLTFGPDQAFAPDLSPSGKIVYKNASAATQLDSIWVMDADGGNARQVYHLGWDPVWSPDGSKILFASGSLSNSQLYIINADGSGLTQLTDMPNIRGRSDWSLQNLIAFYAGASWQRNLYTIEANGSNLQQITNGGNSQAPSFSPDGNWIAFTAYFDNMNNPNGCEIYIIRTDGSDLKRLTSNSYCDWQPRWGP